MGSHPRVRIPQAAATPTVLPAPAETSPNFQPKFPCPMTFWICLPGPRAERSPAPARGRQACGGIGCAHRTGCNRRVAAGKQPAPPDWRNSQAPQPAPAVGQTKPAAGRCRAHPFLQGMQGMVSQSRVRPPALPRAACGRPSPPLPEVGSHGPPNKSAACASMEPLCQT
jgi:hypothetical protein